MVEPLAPELSSRIATLRAKAFRGENLTREEYKEAIRLLRQGRMAAQEAAAKSRRKAPANPSAAVASVLGDLGI